MVKKEHKMQYEEDSSIKVEKLRQVAATFLRHNKVLSIFIVERCLNIQQLSQPFFFMNIGTYMILYFFVAACKLKQ